MSFRSNTNKTETGNFESNSESSRLEPYLNLPPELLAQAFPFHVVFDRNCEILQAGSVLQRILSKPLIGTVLEQHFEIQRPKVALDFEAIRKRERSLFVLSCIDNQMQLKGQMLYVAEQDVIFFLCSLNVTDTAELAPLGVKLKDFAIHDPIADFLFVLQAKNTALTDAEKLTKELSDKQEKLNRILVFQRRLTKAATAQAHKLKKTIQELQETQAQLIQSEKMSGLGQMVAGVAHEINNPVNFIHGNLTHVNEYAADLLYLIQLYNKHYPDPIDEIATELKEIDLEFLLEDLPKTLKSMQVGTERICEIVKSLRTFSRLDEADLKQVDLHEGLDSTLMILDNRIKATAHRATIEIVKEYAQLPPVECYSGQLNQVFMNLLVNAIDAIDESFKSPYLASIPNPGKLRIQTELVGSDWAEIRISNTGVWIPDTVRSKLFDPFFTTKPVGKGTGLGLSVSYKIVVDRHRGKISCISPNSQGETEFTIAIPLRQEFVKT
jgi:two-component system, NtrC family, sensor kinase